jgi:hypothetical protein
MRHVTMRHSAIARKLIELRAGQSLRPDSALLEAFFDQAIDPRPPHAHLDHGDDRQQSRAYQNQRQSSDSVFVDHCLDMDVGKAN